jgi:Na+-transporting NADH:ubiquinone oxidoreductase subunit C
MSSDAQENKDSIRQVIIVALVVCLVCAIFVAGSVVILRPQQVANKNLDTQRNILVAAGLYQPGMDVAAVFDARISIALVDLRTGEVADPAAAGITDVVAYDQRIATKDPNLSAPIPADKDIASLKRKAFYAKVYLIKNDDGPGEKLVLPVSGYGLWSTLYGYLVLDDDLNTVVGITFTEHGETPGLGGEVDNPKWKAQWPGKQVYDAEGHVKAGLKKGPSLAADPFDKQFLVDGLAGATLTSNGVNYMIRFWLGDDGFGPFLTKLKSQRA